MSYPHFPKPCVGAGVPPVRAPIEQFIPTNDHRHSSNDVYKFGVPINEIFEHLDATIAEATPLYELCANVLRSAPP
jgi:hypothetical protein